MINAMQDLGALGSGEQPSAEEYMDMMDRLNWLLKSWQADGCNLWRETEDTASFTTGTATVTLDPIVIDVIEARLIQSSTFERPLQRWERGEYMAIPNKANPGFPTAYYLNKQRDSVTMTVWPVPSQNMDVKYTYARVIEDVTDPNETLDVPQQWAETVWTNLAVRCATMFGASRLDPAAVAQVTQRAAVLEDKLMSQDRPASVFLGSIYARNF